MNWKCAAIVVIALILCAGLLAPVAAAKKEGRGEFREEAREHGRFVSHVDGNRFYGGSSYYGVGGYYPAYSYPAAYPVSYPVAYPVFVPANFGGDQGACYQACVNSGQYSPAQCGQMCYYA